VFTSGFQEGNSTTDNGTSSENGRIIDSPENFDVYHNILSFLYTGIVVFEMAPDQSEPTKKKPRAIDVHTMYDAADRFLLPDLKQKAFDFLKKTCTVDNITSRVFGECASLHDELTKYYDSYFKDNIQSVLESSGYKDFFEEEEAWTTKKRADINTKVRALLEEGMKGLEKTKKRRVDYY
jgi:hypothetical protein